MTNVFSLIYSVALCRVVLYSVVFCYIASCIVAEMESAVSALNGRYFAGRSIVARPHYEQSHDAS